MYKRIVLIHYMTGIFGFYFNLMILSVLEICVLGFYLFIQQVQLIRSV